jgi:hypothetical protein
MQVQAGPIITTRAPGEGVAAVAGGVVDHVGVDGQVLVAGHPPKVIVRHGGPQLLLCRLLQVPANMLLCLNMELKFVRMDSSL